MGVANFDWARSGSEILPGAICENLTSFGGRLLPTSKQTKLTEFLRFGAAGSSGTVIEPMAIQAKFPRPRIHTHYVRGCTLAESFYQSVEGPFQLLIIGDALCRPWAVIPKLTVSGDLESQTALSGEIEIQLNSDESPVPVRATDIFLDGRLVRRIVLTGTGPFRVDSRTMPDGYHEFRFVAVAGSAISNSVSAIIPFVVDNQGKNVEFSVQKNVVNINDTIRFTASAPGADSISLIHNGRSLATETGDQAKFKIAAYEPGRGPVYFEAVATFDNQRVRSRPVKLEITGPISTTIPVLKSPPRRNKKKPRG